MVNKQFSPTNQQYFKRNFSEVIDTLIPTYYFTEDAAQFGENFDPIDLVINSQIDIASNINSIIEIPEGTLFSSLANYEDIAQFFIKTNSFSDIDKFKFEKQILYPASKSFKDFNTSASFKSYVDSTFIPSLYTGRSDPSSVDFYCNQLGWFYLLAAPSLGSLGASVEPSSIVSDYLCKNLYVEGKLDLADGVNAITEYVWRNNLPYYPGIFASGAGEYVSGTQCLDNLKTLNSIIHSKQFLDRTDTYVKDSFEYYNQTGSYRGEPISNGAFFRLIKGLSFAFADMQSETNQLRSLYDFQDCPDEYLPEIADLIGWNLAGYDRNKWRLQLANATSIYKKAGTKASLQAALNNMFSEGGIDIENNLIELWESYIPYLIFYALATDSYLFRNYETFTLEVATELGIDNYDYLEFENNIRAAVDRILFRLYEEHPSVFNLGNAPFPQDLNSINEDFTFRYRNKINLLPPFEEIPYYLYCDVNEEFIKSVGYLLTCFGVSEEFSNSVVEYIKSKTIFDFSDIATNNSWMIFTSSLEYPPNWADLTTISEKDKTKYISLWNGKSSHFMLNFAAGSFIFSKVDYTPNSRYALVETARVAEEFSPAHSIPLINAFLSGSSDYSATTSSMMEADFDSTQYTSNLSSVVISNFYSSGLDFLTPFSLVEFSGLGRNVVNSIYHDIVFLSATDGSVQYPSAIPTEPSLGVSSTVIAPRTTLRRRNYKNALDFTGYYDRSGFNPPIFKLSKIPGLSAHEDSALFYRGLIPSSLSFASTVGACSGNLSSYPDVYKYCSPNHSNPFFGAYYLSGTIPTRGFSDYFTDYEGSSLYQDRAQLDPFIALIWKIEQNKLGARVLYENTYGGTTPYFEANNYWYNFSGSEANKLASCGRYALSSIDGYYNYSLGYKFHQFFKEYLTTFNYHPLASFNFSENKTDILTHAFGSILNNSNFENRGSLALTYDNLYTSALNNVNRLTLDTPVFKFPSSFDTEEVTVASAKFLGAKLNGLQNTKELVNSNIIKDVDIIHTSGVSTKNSFVIYDLQYQAPTSFANNNTIIKLKTINGLPRLRFHVSGTDQQETRNLYRENPFLSPEHEFSITIKGLAALDSGRELSDVQLGVWIHTPNVGGFSYHYDASGSWRRVLNSTIDLNEILTNLSHKISFTPENTEVSSFIFKCQSESPETLPESKLIAEITNDSSILFNESYFSDVTINFDTLFRCRTGPVLNQSVNNTSSIHTLGQHYIIEVFMIPDPENVDKSIYIDSISLRDDTLWDHTKIDLYGQLIPPMNRVYCDPIQLALSEEETRIALKSFAKFGGKNRSTAFLSRNETQTSGVHYTSGGSRLSHRESPSWYAPTRHTTKQITNISID